MSSAALAIPASIQALHAKVPELPHWGGLLEALDEMDKAPDPNNAAEANQVISHLEQLCPSGRLSTVDAYRCARLLSSVVTGVWCSVHNRQLGDDLFGRIDALLNLIQRKTLAFTRSQRTKDKDVALLSRYAVWNRRWPQANHRAILLWLHDKGVLRKTTRPNSPPRFFVIGLAAKVGDNVFTIDRRGRAHRQYLTVVALQAFPVSFPDSDLNAVWGDQPRREPLPQSFIDSVPDLDTALYETTYFGDGKGFARTLPVCGHEVRATLVRLGFM